MSEDNKINKWKTLGVYDSDTGEVIDGGLRVYEAFIALAKDKQIAGRAN